MGLIHITLTIVRSFLRGRAELAAENLALRQQLAILEQRSKQPRLHNRDRIFWVWLSRLWSGWRSVLVIVQPETVVCWHQQGFRLYWRWKWRPKKPGRPKIDDEVRLLIRQMSTENAGWGAPRIQSELALLGIDLAESTVTKYMVRNRKPPSQTWRAFLDNHLQDIVAVDFFTVPSATFRILFVFALMRHERRFVLHFNVTANPTARWTAQQVVEAFPNDEAPRFLLRDRDSIYGHHFKNRVKNMGIEDVVTAPRSPWQNPFVERLIGSVRRECLNHVIVLNDRHLQRILRSYFEYYQESRPHLSLNRNSPIKREVETNGKVISMPMVGGLHHRYSRAA